MIGLAGLILMQAATPDVVPPPTVQAYYDCAANGAERLAPERAGRAPGDIVAEAISACAPLRGPALHATLSLMLADPGVREWMRTQNVAEDRARRVGEMEFDRALRRQLIINLGVSPDEAGEAADADD